MVASDTREAGPAILGVVRLQCASNPGPCVSKDISAPSSSTEPTIAVTNDSVSLIVTKHKKEERKDHDGTAVDGNLHVPARNAYCPTVDSVLEALRRSKHRLTNQICMITV